MKNVVLKSISAALILVALGIAFVAVSSVDIHLTAIGIFAVPALWFSAQTLMVFVPEEESEVEETEHTVIC